MKQSLEKVLDQLNLHCDDNTCYWISKGTLWCGENKRGEKIKVCNLHGNENFTILPDGYVRLKGADIKANWILKTYGPEFHEGVRN
jgi:hypothetical protein